MKNGLIAVLIIVLAVSLWFNWKGSGKESPHDPNLKVLRPGKDSLKFSFYRTSNFNGPSDDSSFYYIGTCEGNNQPPPCPLYAYGRPPINDTSHDFRIGIRYPFIKIDIIPIK